MTIDHTPKTMDTLKFQIIHNTKKSQESILDFFFLVTQGEEKINALSKLTINRGSDLMSVEGVKLLHFVQFGEI